MLSPLFTDIGIGYAHGGIYGTTWVADFGTPQGDAPYCTPEGCGGGTPAWNYLPIYIPNVGRD